VLVALKILLGPTQDLGFLALSSEEEVWMLKMRCSIFLKNKFGKPNYLKKYHQAYYKCQRVLAEVLISSITPFSSGSFASYLDWVVQLPEAFRGKIAEHTSILLGSSIKHNIYARFLDHSVKHENADIEDFDTGAEDSDLKNNMRKYLISNLDRLLSAGA